MRRLDLRIAGGRLGDGSFARISFPWTRQIEIIETEFLKREERRLPRNLRSIQLKQRQARPLSETMVSTTLIRGPKCEDLLTLTPGVSVVQERQ